MSKSAHVNGVLDCGLNIKFPFNVYVCYSGLTGLSYVTLRVSKMCRCFAKICQIVLNSQDITFERLRNTPNDRLLEYGGLESTGVLKRSFISYK